MIGLNQTTYVFLYIVEDGWIFTTKSCCCFWSRDSFEWIKFDGSFLLGFPSIQCLISKNLFLHLLFPANMFELQNSKNFVKESGFRRNDIRPWLSNNKVYHNCYSLYFQDFYCNFKPIESCKWTEWSTQIAEKFKINQVLHE